jgi:hypothetical protein
MQRINASQFAGPRAYFTNIDHRMLGRTQVSLQLKRAIERELKVLLLTKHTVVCAASHLRGQFAYELLRENPVLLDKEMIVPALRNDRADIADIFVDDTVPHQQRDEMKHFYAQHLQKVVGWDLVDNNTWFQHVTLHNLEDEQSVLRRNLACNDARIINEMIQIVRDSPSMSRGIYDQCATLLTGHDQQVMLNFRDILYHMSGSRVIRCESHLPPATYIDFSQKDMATGEVALDETSVFWKIFMEVAFESLHRPLLPVEVLDVLTYDDIYHIRQPLQNSTFLQQYDQALQQATRTNTYADPLALVHDVEVMMQVREDLQRTFHEIFAHQRMPFVQRQVTHVAGREFAKSAVSIGLGLLGIIPNPVTAIVSVVGGVALEAPSLMVNLYQRIRRPLSTATTEEYVNTRNKTLHQVIQRMNVQQSTVLMDAANIITRALSEKMRL